MWDSIIWWLKLFNNSKTSFKVSWWWLLLICSICFWWKLCTTNLMDCVFLLAIYKGTMKVINFSRPLSRMVMNFLEYKSFVLFMGRKLFQIIKRICFSNTMTWWHSNSSWRLHLSIPLCFTFSFLCEDYRKFLKFFLQWIVKSKFYRESVFFKYKFACVRQSFF